MRSYSTNRQAKTKQQESNIFNIKNEQQANNCHIEIQLSSKIIKIRFYQLCKYSELAEEEYCKLDAQERLSKDIKHFQDTYNIKDQSIETFFSIIKEEDVRIINDQFRDLFKLSELFKVKTLQNYLTQYAQRNYKDVNFIINLLTMNPKEIESILPNDEFSSNLEQLLSSQIDKCLQNENFGKLNISIISRVIEKSQKNVKNDVLYEFISKSIDDRYVLFPFIDIGKLSESNFNDLINGYLQRKSSAKSFYYQYLPANLMYVKKLKDDLIKSDKAQNNKLLEIKDLNSQIKALKNENAHLNSLLKNLPPQIKDQAERIQNMIEKKKKMDKMLNRISNEKCDEDINFETVKLIFSNYKSSNKTPFYFGCETGNIQIIKYFLSQGVDDINAKYISDDEENTVLTRAVINNHLEIVKLLVKIDKIDPNIKSIGYSLKYENQDRHSIYVMHHSEKTALYIAVENENAELVRVLLSCPNIDVNLRSIEEEDKLYDGSYSYAKSYYKGNNFGHRYRLKYEKTPLHLAIEKNNIEIIQLLLEQEKIDINVY